MRTWMGSILVAGMVMLVSGARASECDWPQFRGPDGQGHAEVTRLPLRWSPMENVLWKTAIDGLGWSSPVVCNGRVFLTTAIPIEGPQGDPPPGAQVRKHRLVTVCCDLETGRRLWERTCFVLDGSRTRRIHRKNSHASPTPIVDGTYVYAHFGTEGTACLRMDDGRIVWTNRDQVYNPVHGSGGSPELVDGKLILICDGGDKAFVCALDARTGKQLWRTPRSVRQPRMFAFATPLTIEVEGIKQVVCPGAGAVVAYDPETGKPLWQVDYPGGYSVIPRPVYEHGLVFVGTGYDRPSLLAIRPTGSGNVTDTHVVWRLDRSAPHTPSPLVVGDELYIVSDNGIASCLDARTGQLHWQKRLGGKFSASPLFAAGRIYLQAEEGEGIVIAPGTDYRELARNRLEPRTFASYAVAGQTLLIRTEFHLYRIGER